MRFVYFVLNPIQIEPSLFPAAGTSEPRVLEVLLKHRRGVSPLKANKQLEVGQASRGGLVSVGVEGSGALKRSKEETEDCGVVLPLEKEDILEGIECSEMPSLG